MDIVSAFANTPASASTLAGQMDSAVRRLGVQRFAYLGIRLPRSGSSAPIIITNYPDAWTLRYRDQNYAAIDPVLLQAPRSVLPFGWRSAGLIQTRPQRQFLGEAAEFGLRSGLTVPIHGPDGELGLVSYVSDEMPGGYDRFLERQRHQLHLLAIYYHALVTETLAASPAAAPVRLSARERDCLSWKAEGKSNTDIGDILGISAKTVDFHLTNARRKFGVATNQQAVAIALLRAMIHPQLPLN